MACGSADTGAAPVALAGTDGCGVGIDNPSEPGDAPIGEPQTSQ